MTELLRARFLALSKILRSRSASVSSVNGFESDYRKTSLPGLHKSHASSFFLTIMHWCKSWGHIFFHPPLGFLPFPTFIFITFRFFMIRLLQLEFWAREKKRQWLKCTILKKAGGIIACYMSLNSLTLPCSSSSEDWVWNATDRSHRGSQSQQLSPTYRFGILVFDQ